LKKVRILLDALKFQEEKIFLTILRRVVLREKTFPAKAKSQTKVLLCAFAGN
jgi:hypothetical protein